MSSTETQELSARVPQALADKVDQLALRIDRPRAWIIERALSAWVQQEERMHEQTLDALADVEAGFVVDHEEVRAWAESLGTDGPRSVPR